MLNGANNDSGEDDDRPKIDTNLIYIPVDSKTIITVMYWYKCHFLCQDSRAQRIIRMTMENRMFDMLGARHCIRYKYILNVTSSVLFN